MRRDGDPRACQRDRIALRELRPARQLPFSGATAPG